jgi:hypothetical protein
MNKNFLITLFLIFCVSFFKLQAQNWLPGFVIVNETDTLFGEVNFRIPRLNQEQALFRKDANSPVREFSPEDIIGYRFTPEGKYFVSKTIEINDESRLVFVEFMVEGMMNLYYYLDADSRQEYYFFESENRELLTLTKRAVEVDWADESTFIRDGELRFIRQDNRWEGLIRHHFQEFAPIAFNPNPFEFTQAGMIDIARTYHDLTCPIGSECIVFENQRPDKIGINVRYSAYASLENFIFVHKYTSKDFFAPSLGATFYFVYPQFATNFGLYLDVSVSRINTVLEDFIYRQQFGHTWFRDIHMDVFPVSGRVGAKYFKPMGRFTPTAKAGFSYRYFLGNIRVYEFSGSRRHNNVRFESDRPVVSFPGIHAAIGSEYSLKNGSALSLYLTFDHSTKQEYTRLSRAMLLANSLTSFGLRLGYIF